MNLSKQVITLGLAALLAAATSSAASASARVRVEFLRLYENRSAVNGGGVNTVDQVYAAQTLSGITSEAVETDAASFGAVYRSGFARIIDLSGAAVCAWGDNPTPDQDTGLRLSSGDERLVALIAGQTVVCMEAEDAPAAIAPWSYAAEAGGITDTSPRELHASCGPGLKNYVSDIQVGNAGAAGTEFEIRAGAAGMVLWRGYAPAGLAQSSMSLTRPFKGAADTLLELALSSDTDVAVSVDVQGYCGP